MRQLNNRIKNHLRSAMREQRQREIDDLRALEGRNWREYWRRLQTLSGKASSQSGGGVPAVALDAAGESRSDAAGIREVWLSFWSGLAQGIESDRFDDEWRAEVEASVQRAECPAPPPDPQLNADITRDEVHDAIRSLSSGKSPGVDGIAAEMLRHGGDAMERALVLLCARSFGSGHVALDWMRGIVVPLAKEGDPRLPSNYRPITLLSIVGKVYTSVLHARLSAWCERHGVLADEQGGFRAGRGCPEQLYTLSELVKLRRLRGRATFACFIDIRKAYDTVWHDGLKFRLRQVGINGRFYDAVCSLYEGCESAVRLGGRALWTDFFPVVSGVRQGCILSPLLYSIFINSLAVELKASGHGAWIDGEGLRQLAVLLYADDIVLLAESEASLQSLMSVVDRYACRWRFQVNHAKCACVRFNAVGAEVPDSVLCIGDRAVPWARSYKYLGVELRNAPRHPFLPFHQRMLASASAAASALSAMGLHSGKLPVPVAVRVYKALVRPLLEYGGEVASLAAWEEAERLQSRVARRILQCPHRASGTAARGELGLMSLESRWLQQRLSLWGRLQRAPAALPARWVYEESVRMYQDPRWLSESEVVPAPESHPEAPWAPVRAAFSSGLSSLWCAQLHRDLASIGQLSAWERPEGVAEMAGEAWRGVVTKAVARRDNANWRHALDTRAHLQAVLVPLKAGLARPVTLEAYLCIPHGGWSDRVRLGRVAVTQLRTGCSLLRVYTGEWERRPRHLRLCPMCARDVEDERHFLLHCNHFDDQRARLFAAIRDITGVDPEKLPPHERVAWMLGNTRPRGCSAEVRAKALRMILIAVGQWFEERMDHGRRLWEARRAIPHPPLP